MRDDATLDYTLDVLRAFAADGVAVTCAAESDADERLHPLYRAGFLDCRYLRPGVAEYRINAAGHEYIELHPEEP